MCQRAQSTSSGTFREVLQSWYGRDSVITDAHESLGAGSAIVSDVQEKSTRNKRLLSFGQAIAERTGPVVGWLDYFQYSARVREHVVGEMRQCEVAHTEGGEFVQCTEKVSKVMPSTWQLVLYKKSTKNTST